MNRKQFIRELENKLISLPYEERKKAISYYEEYFDDAGAENEDNVICELGDIERIAQEIIENSSSSSDSISVNKFVITEENYHVSSESNKVYSNDYNGYDRNNNSQAHSRSGYEGRQKPKMKTIYIVLIVIGAIASFPIIMTLFGLLMGLFGMIIGVIGAAFGIVVSGIVAVFSIPFVGFAAIGTIIYHLGKGILSIALLILIFMVFAKLIRAIADFIRNK